MPASDPIGALVRQRTGRTVDQHALDTHPAAAQLPGYADLARRIRGEVVQTIDDLRDLFAAGADADSAGIPETVLDPVIDSLVVFVGQYLDSRAFLDTLIGDLARRRVAVPSATQIQRVYVGCGDTIQVILPSTQVCLSRSIAGRPTLVTVADADAETDLVVGASRLRLGHHDAGIYRDPADARLYVLHRAAI